MKDSRVQRLGHEDQSFASTADERVVVSYGRGFDRDSESLSRERTIPYCDVDCHATMSGTRAPALQQSCYY